jgi:hypothetical protein
MTSITTRSSPRPPTPKHPLFTSKFFSTKSFGPGHIVGAGILVLGVVGLSKLFIIHSHAESARRLAGRSPTRPEDEPKVSQIENARGQYGRKP